VLFDAIVEGEAVRIEVREKGGRFSVTLGSRTLEVDYVETGRDFVSLLLDGESHEVGLSRKGNAYSVVVEGGAFEVVFENAIKGALRQQKAPQGKTRLQAPMPGKVLKVLVASGEEVEEGQAILVIEAMKMENELRSPRGGKVSELPVREGQTVETGALLAVVE
jgi:biotin carboxyl carrier protein